MRPGRPADPVPSPESPAAMGPFCWRAGRASLMVRGEENGAHGRPGYDVAEERGPVGLLRRAAALGAATLVVPAPAYAHTGTCTTPEKLSTVVIGLAAGVAVMRPWRRTMQVTARSVLVRLVIPAVIVSGALTTTACGGKSTPARPLTSARLQILQPAPNEVTGADLTIRFAVVGGTVVPATKVSGPLRGDQGHIHVSVDGALVSMAFGTTQDLHGLRP